jgi:hypothetical protein
MLGADSQLFRTKQQNGDFPIPSIALLLVRSWPRFLAADGNHHAEAEQCASPQVEPGWSRRTLLQLR